MKKWYRKLSLPLAVIFTLAFIAGSWALARAADTAADGQRLNPPGKNSSGQITTPSSHAPVPVLVGGMSSADTVSHVLRTTSGGYAQNYQMNRQSDDNTIILLWSGDVGPRTTVTSSYADLRKYKDVQLHIDWADSLKTGGSQDSLLLRIFPVGKISQSNDGFDYYINTIAKGVTADTSAAGYGFIVGSPLNLRAANWMNRTPFYPNWYYTPTQTAAVATTWTYIYGISIPLSAVTGKAVYEDIMGFVIQNVGGFVDGKSIAHSLTISLVAKAN